jgi:hypothetical protein
LASSWIATFDRDGLLQWVVEGDEAVASHVAVAVDPGRHLLVASSSH